MPDAGSWPDWIAAGIAALALIAASVAAWATIATNTNQQAQLDEIRRLEREKQANAFAVWIDVGPDHIARYRISNRSGQPIFSFTVWWDSDTRRCRPRVCPTIPPGEWWMFETIPMFAAPEPFGPTEDRQYFVEYTFTDQAQQDWKRSWNGKLTSETRIPHPDDLIGPAYEYHQDDDDWWRKSRQ